MTNLAFLLLALYTLYPDIVTKAANREDPGLYNPTVEELKEIDPWYKEHAE